MPSAHRDRLKIMNLTKVIMIIVMGLYEVLPVCGQNKVSLTFVIDDTLSMKKEINEVLRSTHRIFQTVTNSNSSIIENFIIVTFNDPLSARYTSEVRVNTKDEKVFRDALTSINVHGGADCPEYPMTGIEHALNESLPGSMLYVFTDASAKDYMNAPRVTALAQEKKSQVTFVLTGKCRNENPAQNVVYDNVAHKTSGEVFNIFKHEVTKILKYVTNQLITKTNALVDKKRPLAKVIPIDIDSSITDITISVTGNAPQIIVKGPDGNTVAAEDIVTTRNIKIVKVPHLKPGPYKIHLLSDNIISVKVTGSTDISFNYGFSKNKYESFEETARRPVSGEEYNLLIEFNSEGQDIILDSIELIDLNENVLLTKSLELIDKRKEIYATDSFVPPEITFKIVIIGENYESHERIKRMSTTPVQPHIVVTEQKAPVVQIQGGSQRYAKINERFRLICKVTGYPKPTIAWEDSFGTILKSQVSVLRPPYDYVSRLDVGKINRNNTYKCKAKNEVGEHDNSVEIYIKSEIPTTTEATEMKKIPIATIEGDLNRIVKYGESLQLVCSVSGYPKPNITWQDGFGSILPTATETPVSGNAYNYKSILKVDKVDKTNAYICIARNEVGAHNVTIEVQLEKKAPVVTIVGDLKRIVKYGEALELVCSVNGYPKPTIVWQDITERTLSTVTQNSDPDNPYTYVSTLHIDEVDKSNSYSCTARNELDADSSIVEVQLEGKSPVVSILGDGNRIVKFGEALQLTCLISGYPKPNITWQDSSGRTMSTVDETPVSGNAYNYKYILKVDKVDKTNAYICIARNELGAHNVTVEVQLEKKAPVVTIVGDLKRIVKYGEALELVCSVNGYPKPTIVWQDITGRTLSTVTQNSDSDEPYTYVSTLHIDEVNKSNSYICTARNELAADSSIVEVQLEGKSPVVSISGDGNRIVKFGEALELTCLISGYPKPNITWQDSSGRTMSTVDETSTSEHPYKYNSTLRIDAVDKDDFYTCTAQNEVDTDSSTIEVQLERISPVVTIEGDPKRIVKYGDSLELVCRVKGYPEPTITWEDETGSFNISTGIKTPVLNDPYTFISTLVFDEVKEENSYICIARNDLGTDNYIIEVQLYEDASTTTMAPKVIPTVAIEGNLKRLIGLNESLTLECKVNGYPHPSITWQDEDGEILPAEESTLDIPYNYASKLFIEKIDKGKAYTCTATNEIGQNSKTVEVSRKKYFNVLKEPQDTTIEYNKEGYLTCKVDAYPPANITWYKNGNEIFESEYVEISKDRYTLHIKEMKPHMSGNWMCEARNGIKRKLFVFNVRISGVEPARIDTSITEIVTSSGSAVDLVCRAKGKPKPKITWYVTYLNGDDVSVINQSGEIFHLSNVTYLDAGTYKCTAENVLNTHKHDIELKVNYAPVIDGKSNEIIFAKSGEYVKLHCNSKGSPLPKIDWYVNGTKIKEKKKWRIFRNHMLKFRASVDDTGNYTCMAVNELGNTTKTTIVEISIPPRIKIPIEYKIHAVANTKVTLDCLADGFPKPEIEWIFYSFDMSKPIKKYKPSTELGDRHFNKIQGNQQGYYTCVAANIGGSTNITYVVHVHN